MCLILIAIDKHPEYPLIIAGNRDEFYQRPTAPLAVWEDRPEIIAGRDLQGNGTWLGISQNGRIAAVTNYRNPSIDKTGALSRGLLVSHFLMGSQPSEHYIKQISSTGDQYNGFNLIIGDVHHLWWFSNITNESSSLEKGIYGISNHLLDTPWPKLEKAKTVFKYIINHEKKLDPEIIFTMLADSSFPPDNRLPDTGVGLDWERILSSVFVSSDVYGTRSSSIILYNNNGLLTFLERTFTPSGLSPAETRKMEIQLEPA